MSTQETPSRRPRFARIGIGTALYLLCTLAVALAGTWARPSERLPVLLGALILAGVVVISLWQARFVRAGRGRYLGLMSAIGAVPLLAALAVPAWEDLPEFALSMSWLFLWLPLYVTTVSGERGACGRPELASFAFWFLITGPLLGGIVLLMTAIL